MPPIDPVQVANVYSFVALSSAETPLSGVTVPFYVAHGVVNSIGMSVSRLSTRANEISVIVGSIDGAVANGQSATLPFGQCKNQASNHAQWTPADVTAEMLVALGEAIGKIVVLKRGYGFANAQVRINMNGTPPQQNSLLSNGNRGTARIS